MPGGERPCRTGSNRRHAVSGRSTAGNPLYLISVRDAAVVRAPRRLLRVLEEMRTVASAVDADLGPSQTGDGFLSHVSARAIEAVCLLMVDSLDFETLMRMIP